VDLAACAAQPGGGDPLDEGAADGYDSSAAKKREDAVAKKFEDARNDPAALAKLVAKLPKGADLHMHLSGAATTESLMAMGAGDNDWVSATYTAQSCSLGGSAIPTSSSTSLYKTIVGAWSTEGDQTAAVSERRAVLVARGRAHAGVRERVGPQLPRARGDRDRGRVAHRPRDRHARRGQPR
jgi:adenosine deaminase